MKRKQIIMAIGSGEKISTLNEIYSDFNTFK